MRSGVEQREFTLSAVVPFRLDFTVWALRRRKANIIDQWDGSRYCRVLVDDNAPIGVVAVQGGSSRAPNLHVTLTCQEAITDQAKEYALTTVRKMLGLEKDLRPFYRLAAGQAPLSRLAEEFSGVKPPRFPTLFEAMVNSIACQQLTLDVGITLLNRLAERFGIVFEGNGVRQHAFPQPEDLEGAAEADLKDLGYSTQKSRAVKELARTFFEHRADFDGLEKIANEAAVGFLTTLRGIGRWSAEYALLRGLGRLDVFPGDDVGAQNNLQRLFHLSRKPDYGEIKQLTLSWRPYEGLVYFHLLLEKLRRKGVI